MLVRLAPTHVRFGSFESLRTVAKRVTQQLADYVIEHHFASCRIKRSVLQLFPRGRAADCRARCQVASSAGLLMVS